MVEDPDDDPVDDRADEMVKDPVDDPFGPVRRFRPSIASALGPSVSAFGPSASAFGRSARNDCARAAGVEGGDGDGEADRVNPATLALTSLVPCSRAIGVTNLPIVLADAAVDRPSRIRSGSSARARLANPIGAKTRRSTAARCASRSSSGASGGPGTVLVRPSPPAEPPVGSPGSSSGRAGRDTAGSVLRRSRGRVA